MGNAVPCQHIADYYQLKWEGHKCIAYNLLRHGYSAWAKGDVTNHANNLYPLPNYIVITHSFKGREVSHCDTVKEAWDAVGRMSFGGLHEVCSPKGLDVEEFVPF